MAITTVCPECGKRFKVDEKLVGRRASCAACKKPFVIQKVSGETPQGSRPHTARPAPSPARPADSGGRATAPVQTTAVACPECHREFRVPKSFVGRKVACKTCQARFVAGESRSVATPSRAAPRTVVGELERGPSRLTQPPAAPVPAPSRQAPLPAPQSQQRVPCPFCGEEIAARAVKCRHCNEFLDGRPSTVAQPAVRPAEPQVNVVVNQQTNVNAYGRQWSPLLAMFLSLLIPGLGQMYKGQPINGIVWFIVVLIGYAALIIPGLIFHVCCVIGAGMGGRRG